VSLDIKFKSEKKILYYLYYLYY